MNSVLKRVLGAAFAISLIAGFSFPGNVEAASVPKNLYLANYRYNDEKVDFTVVASRCVTKATKALRDKDVKQATKDGEQYDVESDPEMQKAFDIYLDGLDISWDAMQEPYCGYGSHGLEAAKKSYVKTVTRVRATFLAKAKKIQQADKN